MYKDKDKQREANRERQRRYKARQKTLSKKGVTSALSGGITDKALPNRTELKAQVDKIYQEFREAKPKRGKDIKCFADLPPDVQKTIDRMSTVDGKIDQAIKVNRTAIAINYQHLFPNRYEPNHFTEVGNMVTGKSGDADYNGVCTAEWRAERGR